MSIHFLCLSFRNRKWSEYFLHVNKVGVNTLVGDLPSNNRRVLFAAVSKNQEQTILKNTWLFKLLKYATTDKLTSYPGSKITVSRALCPH